MRLLYMHAVYCLSIHVSGWLRWLNTMAGVFIIFGISHLGVHSAYRFIILISCLFCTHLMVLSPSFNFVKNLCCGLQFNLRVKQLF
jgi:hypothetical protein